MRSDEVKSGYQRAPNRALLRSLGLTSGEMKLPFIGIANAWNDIVPGHQHLKMLSRKVREGIAAAGGVPFEFGVIGICDGIAMGHEGMRYSLPSRENIADSIELMVEAHRFDGLVLVCTCDKIVPGMLMAAARCNIPAIMVTGGPMQCGYLEGKELSLIDVFEGVGRVAAGKMTEEELSELETCAMPGCGSCQGLYTANTMACMTEAMGMSLPGCAAVPAVNAEKLRIARMTGERVMGLVNEGLRPREIITEKSLTNAVRVDMALGGSTNTVLHLMAIAMEADRPAHPRSLQADSDGDPPHLPHAAVRSAFNGDAVPKWRNPCCPEDTSSIPARRKDRLGQWDTGAGRRGEDTRGLHHMSARQPGQPGRGTADTLREPCTTRCCHQVRRGGRRDVAAHGACPGL